MKMIFKAAVVALALTFTAPAFAAKDGVLFGLSLLKYDTETEGATIGTSEVKNTFYDLKIGHTSSKLYLGGIFSTATTESGAFEEKRTALGGTVGYHNGGFLLDFSLFLQAENEGGGISLTKGTGYGLDFGYNTMVSSNFFVGLQMSYKSFTFKEVEGGGATIKQENKIKSEFYPMLNAGFVF